MGEARPDGRVERGNQTRQLVLARAVQVASTEGLDGLSLGRLATELKLSKSGVFALFGSKEELQLATVRAAVTIFVDHVLTPTRAVGPGLGRVWRMCESWLTYSRTRVFRGGCFFYATIAEFDSRKGKVHDALAATQTGWVTFVEETLEEARVR
ncbi:TetR/AcrR family transcriptional regulator, partial [Streptomyces griseolus]